MFKEYIKEKIKTELPNLKLNGVYAISFFLNCNEVYVTIPQLSISCNTENEENMDPMSEERWNFAFWLMNVIDIISEEDRESINKLQEWYKEIGVNNPGFEDMSWDVAYDNGRYIGKGPEGIYEFVQLVKEIIQELHNSGFIIEVFGKAIPIIIHDLEYVWYMIDSTVEANPKEIIIDFENYITQW